MMIGFGGLAHGFPISEWPGHLLMYAWNIAFASIVGLWTTWTLLFAVFFPTPSRLDLRMPWLKWFGTAPLILVTIGMAAFFVGREISFAGVEFLAPFMQWGLKFRPDLIFPVATASIFFLLIGVKSITSPILDGKRRLRILLLGSLLSFGPIFLESIRALEKQSDLLNSAGPVEVFATLLPLLFFPLTLSYVIVIRRAMDVQSTLRQGIQYALAQRGLTVLQIIVTAAVISAIAVLSASKVASLAVRIETIAAGFFAILLLRRGAQWLAQWIDRRFFREAYNSEQVLSELTVSLRTLMEEHTLIQTLTHKVSAALHVPNTSFLLNGAGTFSPAYATGSQTPALTLPENGGVVRHLKVSPKAAPIYFDDETNWVQTIHPSEQEPLKTSQTEVVLPVSVKDKLLGVLTLGPKQSDAPLHGT